MESRLRITVGGVVVMAVLAIISALTGNAKAATTAQLQSQVSAAMPAASAQVAQAAAQGSLAQLVQQADAMPMPAPDTTSVKQYALLQALEPYATGSGEQLVVSDSATLNASSASTCWFQGSHLANRWNFYEGGVKVAWAEKDHGYWCGNGSSITSNGLPGYYRQHWTQSVSPFCMVDVETTNGWDAPNHAWAHGILVTHFGSYTPWTSCVTYQSSDPRVIRINAKGGHDNFNDF